MSAFESPVTTSADPVEKHAPFLLVSPPYKLEVSYDSVLIDLVATDPALIDPALLTDVERLRASTQLPIDNTPSLAGTNLRLGTMPNAVQSGTRSCISGNTNNDQSSRGSSLNNASSATSPKREYCALGNPKCTNICRYEFSSHGPVSQTPVLPSTIREVYWTAAQVFRTISEDNRITARKAALRCRKLKIDAIKDERARNSIEMPVWARSRVYANSPLGMHDGTWSEETPAAKKIEGLQEGSCDDTSTESSFEEDSDVVMEGDWEQLDHRTHMVGASNITWRIGRKKNL